MASLQDLEVLEREQCLELLRKAPVGRLIFTEHALPAVQPVDFRWWRGDVVIRIAEPAVLAAASGNRVVAFETDELDADLHCGWSVTVVGHAQVITEVPDLIELSGVFSRPRIGGRRDYFVRIRTEKVTGRRLSE
jgi:nitroimidazol reductase NimA-like FMN-containing flavoprotein (pyridoxamine 5'-phosphate oxidase superfamily)